MKCPPSRLNDVRLDGQVWMASRHDCISAARLVAVDAMRALGHNPEDFRLRDKVVLAIFPTVNDQLDSAFEQGKLAASKKRRK